MLGLEVDPPRLLVLRAGPQPELGLPDATVTRVELHHLGGRISERATFLDKSRVRARRELRFFERMGDERTLALKNG